MADATVAGSPVELRVAARRFFCDESECPARTFVEQIEGLTSRHVRRSPGLTQMLQAVALALAGRAGVRLAARLGVAISRSTLLRLIRALPDPPRRQVQVLGVDDFALRRGHVYATVLVDMGTHQVIDVLPDRNAEPLAAWLADRDGIEVICRDRSGSYADAAHRAVPGAIQVADRFHLWQNLAVAVERCVIVHRSCLAEPPPSEPAVTEPAPAEQVNEPPEPADPTGRFADRARHHHGLVHDLIADGHGLRAIARHLGWGRHTVQRYARAKRWQDMVKGRARQSPSKLDRFKSHLRREWEAGRTNISALFREITTLGYQGSYATVQDWMQQFRTARPTLTATTTPSIRRVTNWITRRPASLTDDETMQLKAILTRCPELDAATGHVRSFAEMLTTLTGQHLPEWIRCAERDALPGITTFARGLRADLDAVINGLTLPFSSGAVEGIVNRTKMLKRQMYGRAGLDLLRKRLLHPA